jgi:MFS family permease
VLPKRVGLLCTQGAACLLALVLGLLVLFGHVQVWQVMALAFCLGIVNAFDMPIRQSFVVEMVGRDDIASAVALNSAAFNGARVIGPAVAGLLIGIIGIGPVFIVNSASYLVVIAGYLLMDVHQLHVPARRQLDRSIRGIADALAEGLRFVRATPIVLLCVSLIGVVSVFALNFPVFGRGGGRDVLGGGAETYGFLMASAGVGSLVSALMLAFGGRVTLGRVFLGGTLAGLGVLGAGFSSLLPLSMVLLAVVGWSTVAIGASSNTIIQLTVPDMLRGRVMSVYTTVFAGATPIGSLLMGALASRAGVTATMTLAGVVTVAFTGLAAVWAIRRQHLPLSTPPALASQVADAGRT